MTTDSISRSHTASVERFQSVVLPATVELIKSAIASSVVNSSNASAVIEDIANAVSRLSSRPGAHEFDEFSNIGTNLSGVPLDVQQVVKNYQKSYLAGHIEAIPEQPLEAPVKRGRGRPKKVALQPIVQKQVPDVRPVAPALTPAARIATPARDKTATPSVTARSPEPAVKPVQEISTPSLAVDMKRRKADTEARAKPLERRLKAPPESTRKLPKGLLSINEAVHEDYIVCLDDGRKVKDLEKHLDSKGVTMESYLKKWGLPSDYPTRAPKLILTKGTVYAYNIHSDQFEAS